MERIEKKTKVKGEKNNMAANVETMFYTREKPWHGLGIRVAEALTSKEALTKAGVDWHVVQKPLTTYDGSPVPGYFANIRDKDDKLLGVVTDRYTVIQNEDAFAFTDGLLGAGVRYETAGSLSEGRRVWILAKLPNEYIIRGDRISPYMVFSKGAICWSFDKRSCGKSCFLALLMR